MYLLDTDHLGILQSANAPGHGNLYRRLREHANAGMFVSVVSFQEQVAGWNSYIRRARNNETLVRGYSMFLAILADFSTMNVLPFDTAAAETFSHLRTQGVRVGTMDLRIGSIALVRNLTLLTKNSIDFQRIPGLRIEDWTLPSNTED